LICDLLEYGAPIDFEGKFSKCSIGNDTNHKRAREFEDGVWKYLNKEASYGASVGSFDKNPFSCNFKASSLNTMSKRGTLQRRAILDLSFPVGNSVNYFISK
jgi:hypothetical protein